MNKFSRTARSVTFAAIVGLSLGVSAPGAFAQVQPVAGQSENSPLINQNAKGKLTIHKYKSGGALGQERTGTLADGANLREEDKLSGIGFVIYKINKNISGESVDLKTNKGLANAAGLKAEQFQTDDKSLQKYVADGTLTLIKNEKQGQTVDGQLVLSELELGAYLVIEKDNEADDGKIYTPAAPFIAFVPMTTNGKAVGDKPGSDQGVVWNYDVHAFPKNFEKKQPEKEVVDKDQNIGGTYAYDIKTRVRNIAEGKQLKYYWIEDDLDENHLKVSAPQEKITVFTKDGSQKEVRMVLDQDYQLDFDEPTQKLVVKFTAMGLAKLKTGTNVRVHVEAEKTTGGEVVENQAREWEPTDPRTDQGEGSEPGQPEDEPSNPTNKVFTYSSGLTFKKVDSGRKGLEGAEFQIVRQAYGEKCSDIVVKGGEQTSYETKTGESLTPVFGFIGGEKTNLFKSSEDGTVQITGLHVNDFENNAVVEEGSRSHYCLIETKAPKGKELLAQAEEFSLTTDQVEQKTYDKQWKKADGTVTKTEKVTYGHRTYKNASLTVGKHGGEVVNLDDTTPQLPLTGGAGVGILAAIGAAIIGAGAWFARRNSAES
ncbi:SpaH/EbpB family LPXTG-anchored major pilin [Corynebacterium diphtheriae]|uniref:SpaH/EbpB family LPXTG-anchored major pilin n=1 Tax=Corynebacterium diphtheriae TaxID=1717 RepID=UPI00064CAB20|nr:SpaH/EbpB family LPXTG-anchored major pilin [Corynebacterium diphtheriae]KLN43529.1 type-2 fimbrial major subunit [Corynebacterium diphtheriae bv. gravis str. ISS 4746]KLN45388.1 type-2 fimbrial major subunit [Corynebacterium diphtheriae bv. gravis str. ISS 4749]OWO11306.1 hypothetical protein AY532_00385 [Corynebacterium diphtheriae bv. gravis]CAB0718738.1 isopeptide-forming domain-containing fimbrial protein [Corynebacterium diphtheriae]